MDELFGDVFDRGLAPRRRGGFSPAVDVYYVGDPPRAVVRADLAGHRPGRASSSRSAGASWSSPASGAPPAPTEERVYQQLEIEHGPFRRVVALGADVDADAARATYEDGILTVELPIVAARAARAPSPIERADGELDDRDRDARRRREDVALGAPPLPDALPVLPLRDTVTFPDTLTPLAVGQERSIQLVNDVLAGDRMLVMVGSKDPELETPGPDQLYTRRRRRHRRAHAQGARRDAADPRPGRPAGADRRSGSARSPTSSPRIAEAPDIVERGPGADRADAQRPADVLAHHRGGPVPARGAADGGRQPRRPVRARAPDRRRAADQDRGEAGAARGARRRQAAAAALGDPRARARGRRASARRSSRRCSPSSTRPSASTSCASSSRRSRRSSASATRPRPRSTSCASSSAASSCPRRSARQADRELSRLEKLPQAAAEHGVIRTYLEWIASLPWDKRRPRTTSTSTHAREVLDADHYDIEKVKDRILEFLAVRQAEARRARLDPVLRRPAGRRQDVARPARSRARWGASSSASRSAACATRPRSAATAAPTSARCRARSSARCATPASNNPVFMIDEIDKMGADFRGDPASAMLEVLDPEQNADVPRPLPRRAVRPLARDVHHHGEHARHDPRPAARPHGGHPARRLHRGGEAPDRQALPRAAPDRAQRAEEVADRRSRDTGLQAIISRLHARGGRAQPRARDRLGLPQGRAPGGGGQAREASCR